jgi:acetate kinase
MLLLFDADPPFLQWCLAKGDWQKQGKCRTEPGWTESIREEIAPVGSPRAVVYVLRHGGDEIAEPATLLTPQSLDTLRRSIRFLPEHNSLTLIAVEFWSAEFPAVPQILLCDTAFFVNLPREASTYAVPYPLRRQGVRRYGGYGLCHEWVWERAPAIADSSLEKVISVYLANRTNMAAIRNARPVETTIGFTPAEGIVSCTGCGDIDPTIVFQLESTGMSFQEINRLLSAESGLSGILGRRCAFGEIVEEPKQPDIVAARRLFRYHILKYVGAFAAVLGGADAIVFTTQRLDESLPFIRGLCEELGFLGFKGEREARWGQDFCRLSASDSQVQVFALTYNKWQTFAYLARRILS